MEKICSLGADFMPFLTASLYFPAWNLVLPHPYLIPFILRYSLYVFL